MQYQVIHVNKQAIVELRSAISNIGDANDLIARCAEQHTSCLLLEASYLPADFFVLSTCFAGEFLQKLQNYQLHTAIVIAPETSYGERFDEYLVEAKRARYSRFFTDKDAALAWLGVQDA